MNQFIKYLAIAFFLASSFGLVAQPGGGPPSGGGGPGGHREDPCKNERQTYCKDAKPGPETHKCLEDNLGKFSETCKTHITEMIARHEKVRTACAADEEKFCKNVDRSQGGPIRCLKSNESKLSATCKAALPQPPPDHR